MKRRSDGRIAKQVYLGMKDSGKINENGIPILIKNYKTIYGKTNKEVEEKALQLKIQIGKGIDITSSNDSFEKWISRFMEYKNTEGLGWSTIYTLKGLCKHFKPIYGMPINKIEIKHIQDIIMSLSKDVTDDNGNIQEALAKRTLIRINNIAKQIFNIAIESRAIDYNPAQYVKIPKNATITERSPITKEQQRWVVEFDHRMKRAAMIMLFAGLRRGEVLALTWADINLKEGFISVNKAIEMVHDRPHVKTPKTKSGIRNIDIPCILIDYLSKEKSKDNCLYVIHTQTGEVFPHTAWNHAWRCYMRDLNVEYGYTRNQKILLGMNPDKPANKSVTGGLKMLIETFTPHQLRHTFATNCYHADIPVEVCRDWMGHSNVQTTLNIYTHLSKEYKRNKKTRLDDFYAEQLVTG